MACPSDSEEIWIYDLLNSSPVVVVVEWSAEEVVSTEALLLGNLWNCQKEFVKKCYELIDCDM